MRKGVETVQQKLQAIWEGGYAKHVGVTTPERKTAKSKKTSSAVITESSGTQSDKSLSADTTASVVETSKSSFNAGTSTDTSSLSADTTYAASDTSSDDETKASSTVDAGASTDPQPLEDVGPGSSVDKKKASSNTEKNDAPAASTTEPVVSAKSAANTETIVMKGSAEAGKVLSSVTPIVVPISDDKSAKSAEESADKSAKTKKRSVWSLIYSGVRTLMRVVSILVGCVIAVPLVLVGGSIGISGLVAAYPITAAATIIFISCFCIYKAAKFVYEKAYSVFRNISSSKDKAPLTPANPEGTPAKSSMFSRMPCFKALCNALSNSSTSASAKVGAAPKK